MIGGQPTAFIDPTGSADRFDGTQIITKPPATADEVAATARPIASAPAVGATE